MAASGIAAFLLSLAGSDLVVNMLKWMIARPFGRKSNGKEDSLSFHALQSTLFLQMASNSTSYSLLLSLIALRVPTRLWRTDKLCG